jgi:hypothetical protein
MLLIETENARSDYAIFPPANPLLHILSAIAFHSHPAAASKRSRAVDASVGSVGVAKHKHCAYSVQE